MTSHAQPATLIEARKRSIRRLFEDIITHGQLELADEIFAEDFYWPQFDLRGPDGVRTWVKSFRATFPDVLDTVQEQIGRAISSSHASGSSARNWAPFADCHRAAGAPTSLPLASTGFAARR